MAWRIRSLEDLCARRIIACVASNNDDDGTVYLCGQLGLAPPFVLEGLWARAAESDRLCDATLAALAGCQLEALELGRIPLGVTERGLSRAVFEMPERCEVARVGWPAHFKGPVTAWLTRALVKGKHEGLRRLEVRAAGLGGAQGGEVPGPWARIFAHEAQESAEHDTDGNTHHHQKHSPRDLESVIPNSVIPTTSKLLGRAKASAFADWASLRGVTDGEVKSLLRAASGSGQKLEVFSVAGAVESEGHFADALADCAPNVQELRFRDAPRVSDEACAALVDAVSSTVQTLDFSRTKAGPRLCASLLRCDLIQKLSLDGCSYLDDKGLDLIVTNQLRELSLRRCPKLTAAALWLAVATTGSNLERLRCDLRRETTLLATTTTTPSKAATSQQKRNNTLFPETSSSFPVATTKQTKRQRRRSQQIRNFNHNDESDDSDVDDDSDDDDVAVAAAIAGSYATPPSRTDDSSFLRGPRRVEEDKFEFLDIPPFDLPFRGRKLESLRVAFAGFNDKRDDRKIRDDWLKALVSVVPASLREFEVRGAEWAKVNEDDEDPDAATVATPPPPACRSVIEALRNTTSLQSLAVALDEPDALFHVDLVDFFSVPAPGLEAGRPRRKPRKKKSNKSCSSQLFDLELDVDQDSEEEDDSEDDELAATNLLSPTRRQNPPSFTKHIGPRLTALNVSCRGLGADRIRLLFPTENRASTLRYCSITSDAGDGLLRDDEDVLLAAPLLETLSLRGVALGTRLVLQRCPVLATLSLRRCVLAGVDAPFRDSAPLLFEMNIRECRRPSENDSNDTCSAAYASSLRRLAVSDDAFFLSAYAPSKATVLRSLTIDERERSSNDNTNNNNRKSSATFGSALVARAATRAAIVGTGALSPSVFDGLVGIELVGVRSFFAKHFLAMATACPALRRLRVLRTKYLRGSLDAGATFSATNNDDDIDDDDKAPTTLTSPRLAGSQRAQDVDFTAAAFWDDAASSSARREAPPADEAKQGDNFHIFDMDTGGGGDQQRPTVRFSEDTGTPPQVGLVRRGARPAAGRAPALTPETARSSRSARKERFDSTLQCHVGSSGAGAVPELMRALADSRSNEYRHYAKLAALLKRDKKENKTACIRHLSGLGCRRGRHCDFSHQVVPKKNRSAAQEKKLRPLYDLVRDIDDFKHHADNNAGGPQSWPPPMRRSDTTGDASDDGSEELASSLNDTDFLPSSAANPPLVFPRLEALELERCDHVEALRVDAPRLLALATTRCERLATLDARCPRLTHLDVHRCAKLGMLSLRPGSFVKLKVANLAHTDLPEFTLQKLVDQCRFLTHLDIHGILFPESKAKDSAPTLGGSPSEDPFLGSGSWSATKNKHVKKQSRTKRKTTAGLDKLKAGRPDLDLVRTRKEHEHPANITRATLNLALA